MFTLFTHKEYGIPTVVSQNSKEYTDYIFSGSYLTEMEGTKKDCLDAQEEILETLLVND